MFAFLANMPGWFGALLGGLACLGFAAYLSLFAVQLVTQNLLTPPLIAAGCFFNPGTQGCPLNMIPPAERQSASAPPPEEAVVVERGPPGDVATDQIAQPPASGTDELDLSGYRVYVQFSPSRLGESSVNELIGEMVSNGWIIPTGPEALPSAFGLNEIRYFHEEDRAAAERLAGAVARLAPWVETVRVRDFTSLAATAQPGLLEVWTSG